MKMHKTDTMGMRVELIVPTTNILVETNVKTGTTSVKISSDGMVIDPYPIDEMRERMREAGISPDICSKVHDAALDVLHKELCLEMLKDFIPGYFD